MSVNNPDLLKIKPSLLDRIRGKRSQQKKIEVCIKEAIENGGLENEADIKDYVKKVITKLGLFKNPETLDNRFNQEWGQARKSLLDEGIISRVENVKIYLVKEPISSEIQNILDQLKKTDNQLAIQNGLQRLWKMSSDYNTADYPGVLNSILKIITTDELFYVTEISRFIANSLSEIIKYNENKKPKNNEQILSDIYTKDIKQICTRLRQKTNSDIINIYLNNLFVYTNTEEPIYTMFDLIEDVSDKDFILIKESVVYALFNKDSILFKKHLSLIDSKMDELTDHKRDKLRDRG